MAAVINVLNEKLKGAREAYYSGSPIMSDAEYDSLEQQLAGAVKAHPEEADKATVLFTVGTDTSGRIPHKYPMRSIENLYTIDDLVAWCEDIGWPVMTLNKKFDGISCSLSYEKGALVKAVTRGDGDAGESILDQVTVIKSVPKTIPAPIDVEVRGELIIRRSTMVRLNAAILTKGGKPFVSTRNLVAGTMKLKDLDEVANRDVQFLPWEVLAPIFDTNESGADSAAERLRDIGEVGFLKTECQKIENKAQLLAVMKIGIERLNEKDPEIALDQS